MLNRIISFINNPSRILLYFPSQKLLNGMRDDHYLRIKYKAVMGRQLDLNDPQTFNEKLQWLKLYDRDPLYTKLVDKYEVKKYIAEIIGEKYLIPSIGVWDKFEDIDFSKLPNQFVLKCTHDSGGLVICKDKSKLDIELAKRKINKSLKINYYYSSREWPYKNVKPRIICEKYMVDESESELKDYKIYCFHGEPKIIQVDYNRFIDHKRNFYDIDWNYIDVSLLYLSCPKHIISRPVELDKMLEFARILSKKSPYVRIDFYSINQNIFFGEMTLYPEAGFGKFAPESYDYLLGTWIELPKKFD